jgi:K+-transporting ATPase c subunit
LLRPRPFNPGGGLFGEAIVNVLEINLVLRERYGEPS